MQSIQLEHTTCMCTNAYRDTNEQVCCVVRAGWTAFTNHSQNGVVWTWCKTSTCKHVPAIHQRMLTNTDSLRFLLSNFRYSLTLFSKFFSSFPHGTCALLVSLVYLALDGIYHPLWAAIPNNSTRNSCALQGTVQAKQTGVSPCILSHSKEFSFAYNLTTVLCTRLANYNSLMVKIDYHWFTCRAFPGSVALTTGILVSFFSSA